MELLSKNQFKKRYNIGDDKLKKMIANKEVDYLKTADRIRIDENTVSIELYNEERAKRVQAETKLQSVLQMVQQALVN